MVLYVFYNTENRKRNSGICNSNGNLTETPHKHKYYCGQKKFENKNVVMLKKNVNTFFNSQISRRGLRIRINLDFFPGD